jgi:ABC-type amino acid transport substrate-binding protein
VSLARRAALLALGAAGAGVLRRAAWARTYHDTVSTVGRNLDELRRDGRIRIAVYADFAPFSSVQGSALIGVDVDLAKLIAQRLGLTLDLWAVTAGDSVDDDLRNYVWRGTLVGGQVANLMLHVPYDRQLEVRSELAALFAPYYRETLVVARDPGQIGPEPSLSELQGHRIAVELDSLPDTYLSSAHGGGLRSSVVRFRRPEEGIAALLAGEVAAFMGLLSQVEAALGGERGQLDTSPMPLPGLAVRSWPIGLAARENARDLGWAATELVEAAIGDGTMASIFASHGLSYHPPSLV